MTLKDQSLLPGYEIITCAQNTWGKVIGISSKVIKEGKKGAQTATKGNELMHENTGLQLALQ